MSPEANRNGEIPRQARPGTRNDYLELWINLARRQWHSLVVIPADREGSTAEIARGLAEIGQRLSFGQVTAVTVNSLEYGSALALADLQQHVERERHARGPVVPVERLERERPDGGAGADAAAKPPNGGRTPVRPDAGPAPARDDADERSEALMVVPPARLIISVPPVIAEPLGLAAAAEADAIILAVRMNHSRLGEVRRTIRMVGRERLAGCFLVR